MNIKDRLKILRGELSQAAFGKRVGASQSSIANYESGRIPDVDFIKSVCDTFGVSADWLIFGKDPESSISGRVTADMSAILHKKESQHIEKTEGEESTIADVGSFSEIRALEKELRGALIENAALLREAADIARQTGDLRVEIERLRARIAQLEADLAEERLREGQKTVDSPQQQSA